MRKNLKKKSTQIDILNKKNHKLLYKILSELKFYAITYFSLLLVFSVLSFYNISKIYNLILKNVYNILQNKLIYTDILEKFNLDISLSFYSGFFFTFPILTFLIYRFFAKALFQNEKKYLLFTLVYITCFFYISFCLLLKFAVPKMILFFIKSNEFIEPKIKLESYFKIILQLQLILNIILQFPILLNYLINKNIISTKTMSKNRKYFILCSSLFSTIITPPDVISQLVCIVFFVSFYEFFIFIKQKD